MAPRSISWRRWKVPASSSTTPRSSPPAAAVVRSRSKRTGFPVWRGALPSHGRAPFYFRRKPSAPSARCAGRSAARLPPLRNWSWWGQRREACVVERVVRLEAELRLQAFADDEVLVDTHVEVVGATGADAAPARRIVASVSGEILVDAVLGSVPGGRFVAGAGQAHHAGPGRIGGDVRALVRKTLELGTTESMEFHTIEPESAKPSKSPIPELPFGGLASAKARATMCCNASRASRALGFFAAGGRADCHISGAVLPCQRDQKPRFR